MKALFRGVPLPPRVLSARVNLPPRLFGWWCAWRVGRCHNCGCEQPKEGAAGLRKAARRLLREGRV